MLKKEVYLLWGIGFACFLAVFLLLRYWFDQARVPRGKVQVFLLLGQSNMEGAGNGDQLLGEYANQAKNIQLYWRGKWRPLKPYSRKDRTLSINRMAFGPEIAFGHELAGIYPDQQMAFFKYAIGGTTMADWLPIEEQGADSPAADKQGMGLYSRAMRDLRRAMSRCSPEYAAVLWMQGESDARQQKAAERYEQNLKMLIASLRKDLKKDDLLFLIGQISNDRDPYVQVVQQAQKKLADQDPFVEIIGTEGLEKYADRLHYNTDGQIELGLRFAHAFEEFVKTGR